MTTAQDVFDLAMSLMDELSSAGVSDTSDNAEYKYRTIPILNILRGELYKYSDTYQKPKNGKRSIAQLIENFDDPIGLDDYICQSVLPYGLAAHLLMQEDPASAQFFQQRYEEQKSSLTSGIMIESEEIEDVYGGIEYGRFSMW